VFGSGVRRGQRKRWDAIEEGFSRERWGESSGKQRGLGGVGLKRRGTN
jgi:hypothetical protein